MHIIMLLSIHNLNVNVGEKKILNDFSLDIKPGEVHAIMGPNGTGKSTLAHVLAGRSGYVVDSGEALFNDKNLLEMLPEVRAREGLFLSHQHPVSIPGVSTEQFLRTSVNEIRKYQGQTTWDAFDFQKEISPLLEKLHMKNDILQRGFNEGFSGGEKKKNELLQLLLLQPKLAILDEIDSGLDIDALKQVAEGINLFRSAKNGVLLITHYQRLLDYVAPDVVHIMKHGRIIQSGGMELVKMLEEKGYQELL